MNTKKAVVLFGSPHKNGATNEITVWAEQYLEELGFECERVHIYGKKVNYCVGCGACQKPEAEFGCVQKDDVAEIAEKVLQADLIIAASPIHGNFLSGPLKVLLDRLVYIMNKYIGRPPADWHSLWDSKHFAVLLSYGVRYDNILLPIDEGMRMYCLHSRLFYDGIVTVHRKTFMQRKQSGDEEQFGDKARVRELIGKAAAACREGRKADWDALTGKRNKE